MQIIGNDFDKVDEAIVEAIRGNITWTDALLICSDAVGADAMTFEAVSECQRNIESLGSFGFSDEVISEYLSYYHYVNPRIEMRRNIQYATILFDDEMSQDMWNFKGGEFRHWLKTIRAPAAAASLVIPRVDNSTLVFAIHRGSISRSSDIVEKFLAGFEIKIRVLEVMDGIIRPNINASGMNKKFRSSMQEATIELDRNFVPCAYDSESFLRLQSLNIIDSQNAGQAQLKFVAKNDNDAFERAIVIATAHLPANFQINNDNMSCTVSIVERDDPTSAGAFAMTFNYVVCASSKADLIGLALGLTKRQSQIVGLVVDGASLAEAARLMDISLNTARVFMAQVFDRIGVRRRIDLIRRVDKLLNYKGLVNL